MTSTKKIWGGAVSLAAFALFAFIGAKTLTSNAVEINNTSTSNLTVTLNYVGGGGQTVTVNSLDDPTIDIGTANLESITIWSQTDPAMVNATISNPSGGAINTSWSQGSAVTINIEIIDAHGLRH